MFSSENRILYSTVYILCIKVVFSTYLRAARSSETCPSRGLEDINMTSQFGHGNVIVIPNDTAFQTEVQRAGDRLVVVDFTASW